MTKKRGRGSRLSRLAVLALLPWRGTGCCPNSCSGHGYCSGHGGSLGTTVTRNAFCECRCDYGYTGGDCTLRSCPGGAAWSDMATATDTAHGVAECSNAGLCNREIGLCICKVGFSGPACERMDCPGGEIPCNAHGVCMSMREHAKTAAVEEDVHAYTLPWDADMVHGCKCDPGFAGHDCMSMPCPVGDDPLTLGQVDSVQVVHCNASHGTFRLSFLGEVTEDIPADATAAQVALLFNKLQKVSGDGGGSGGGASITFSGRGQKTACGVNRVVTELVDQSHISVGLSYNVTYFREHNFTITFEQIYGPQKLVEVQDASALSDGASMRVAFSVNGTKESEPCANRGLCDVLTGICTCVKDFDTSDGKGKAGGILHNRGDCGFSTGSITSCPGEVKCSAHGVCQETDYQYNGALRGPSYRCACSEGWRGPDCSERQCPVGPAWFDYPAAPQYAHAPTECSNRGVCDRSKAECTCDVGFTGGACQRHKCPSATDFACSGHGRCLAMNMLAEKHTDDYGGAAANRYGEAPNNPRTWDFDSMTGCYCDEGYHGFDCSLMSCPVGDDPKKRNLHNEVQAFTCTTVPVPLGDAAFTGAVAGTPTTYGAFTVAFRGVETAWIDHQATEATVKAQLEKLRTLGKVEVVFMKKDAAVGAAAKAAADVACTGDGSNVVQVKFLTELGNLPDLTFRRRDSVQLGSIELSVDGRGASHAGTRAPQIMCSNRGICNEVLGICTCFHGYGSSDGAGGPGTRGDCGHYLEYGGIVSAF
jgi:hypothetical protein